MTDIPPSADPDSACPHEVFDAEVTVNEIVATCATPVQYSADIRVGCAQCGEKFRWNGCQVGTSPSEPTVSVDGTELRAPLRPASADPDLGLGWVAPDVAADLGLEAGGTP